MTKKLLLNLSAILCLLLIASPLAVVILRYDGLYFLLYLTFWVITPGYLILHAFKSKGLECKTKALGFIYAFLLGCSSLFVEFFILHFLNQIELIKYINPLIAVFAIYIFYKKYIQNKLYSPRFNCLSDQLPFLLLLLAATYLCACSLNIFMPTSESVNYEDFTWQISNIAQLAGNTPFEDIRVAGSDFKYHYFNSLFYAIAKIIFDIPSWIIFTQHQIFIIPLLVSLSFYSLFINVAKNKWVASLFSVFAFLGFGFFGNFLYQWSSNINAVALATIVACAMFAAIKPILSDTVLLNRKTISHIILFNILLLFISGVKGPYGAMFILTLICFILMKLIRKEKPTNSILLLTATSSVMFLVIYNLLLSSGGSFYFSNNFFEGILASVTVYSFFAELNTMRGARVFLFIPSLLIIFSVTIIPLCLSAFDCVLHAISKKTLKPAFIFAAFFSVIGITAYYTFSLTGFGQVYFLLATVPFTGYLSLSKMMQIVNTHTKLRKACISILIVFVIICIPSNIHKFLTDFSFNGIYTYFSGEHTDANTNLSQEFDAFEFLNKYVQDDKLVISNRQFPLDDDFAVYHNISAFGEVNCYLEGYLYAERNTGYTDGAKQYAMVQNFFSDSLTTTEKHAFALAENIGYVFIFAENEYPTIHPETGEFFEEIFANDAVTIYEVLV